LRNLTRASEQLFRRTPDECYPSLAVLLQHCRWQKEESLELWQSPQVLGTKPVDTGRLMLAAGDDQRFEMTDWSFSQLCRLAGVGKDTVNRLSPETADRVFRETLPQGNKPLQLFTQGSQLRSIHAATYTRLYNADVLDVVAEYATDFEPPPKGVGDATGLYAGEQDAFCFLIDPAGWTDIEGEAFAPGLFVWNSEVGRCSVGVETFWFQACCQNHIVWDAVEVVDFSRKYTANVSDLLNEIRRIIESLVQKRDQRRDGFVRVIGNAMKTTLGDNVDEVAKVLANSRIARTLAKEAIRIAEEQGSFTVFSLVDALTRLDSKLVYASDRVAADQKAARLLALAA
jgi:hypothetical protein